jgi:hypothetical protein
MGVINFITIFLPNDDLSKGSYAIAFVLLALLALVMA